MSSLQQAWDNFQGGVKSALHQWTALRLAVENNWGGGDSERKAQLLEEELINMFKTKKELFRDEVEDFLADALDDSFSTYAEDGSPRQVAAMLIDMFAQCGRFDYTLANTVREEEQRRLAREASSGGARAAMSPSVARSIAVKRDDCEDFSSSDEDDDMEGGGGAASARATGSAAAAGMEVEGGDGGGKAGPDPDGWETVPNKKSGKGRRR